MSYRPPRFSEFCTLRDRLCFGQRVLVAVLYDETNPVDLPPEWRPRATELFGAVDTIPSECHRFKTLAKGRGIGGTRLAAEFGVWLAATAPIEGVDRHELVYAFIGGPKLRHAGPGLRFALEAARHHGIPVTDESKDGFTLVRPDGYRVRFEAFAASRGGDNIRGVPILFALLTEAAFYLDEATGAANGEAIFGAIVPRLLRHGRIVIESTVWAEVGLLYREFVANHGHPTTGVAAFCPTRLVRDDAETLAMIELEHQRDPHNARRELEVEWLSIGSLTLFNAEALRKMARQSGYDLYPVAGTVYAGAIDPGKHRVTLVIVALPPARQGSSIRYQVAVAREWEGPPDQTLREAAQELRRFGLRAVHTDQFASDAFGALALQSGLQLVEFAWTAENRTEAYGSVATLVESGQLELHPDQTFLEDLRSVRQMPRSGGGWTIDLPRRNGRHCDFAPALASAIKAISPARRPLSEAEQFELAKQTYRANQHLGMFGLRVEYDEFGRRQYFRAAETIRR